MGVLVCEAPDLRRPGMARGRRTAAAEAIRLMGRRSIAVQLCGPCSVHKKAYGLNKSLQHVFSFACIARKWRFGSERTETVSA